MLDARDFVTADADRLLDEWGTIARVPAPLDGEAERVELVRELAVAAGADARVDAAGNVVADLPGTDPDGEVVTVLATLDDLGTVAEHRTAAGDRLVRDGDRFVGPATETTSSDATALALARYLVADPLPFRLVRIAWVIGEETGLTGVRALVDEHGAALGSVVDLMGGVGTVSWNAIGFAGLEVTFRAQPRHSLYGGVSEVSDAIARFVTALHAAPLPVHGPPFDADPLETRRVNRIHAGTVFNHSPETGVVGVDVRGTDAGRLAELESDTRRRAEAAAAAAGVEVVITDGERQPAMTLPGGREHRLVRALAQGIRDAGHDPVMRAWSSSNVNVAYAAGLPGVVHDGTHRGGGRGTADEWTWIPGVLDGLVADIRMLRLLARE